MKGKVHSRVLPSCAERVWYCAGPAVGVWFPAPDLSPPAWRLTPPRSSFSQWRLSEALWHHCVGEDWWTSQTLTTWAINLWHYPFTLAGAVNNYGMFMEAMSKNMSYFTLSTIKTSHDWTPHLQKKKKKRKKRRKEKHARSPQSPCFFFFFSPTPSNASRCP